MGEALGFAAFGLVCAAVGMIWGVRVGRSAEERDWLSQTLNAEAGDHIRRRGGDWIVMSMERFYSRYRRQRGEGF